MSALYKQVSPQRRAHAHTPPTPIGPAPAPTLSPGPKPNRAPIANVHPSLLFRNNTAFVGAVFAGAFAFELAYDNGMDKVWDKINKGVRAYD
ncbi:subunit X of cytochrome bc1 complex [Neurospora intermedia]|uniref:Complex III subunit 9 n=1 Tax=Neurospora intermedia TaxID=5142 RepID=A0ABR3DP53_NEUIN